MYLDKDGGELEQKVVLNNAERKSADQMNLELEEQRELANSRLNELEHTSSLYKDTLKEVERLKMELSTLPEHVVVETTEHKCLQSQFSGENYFQASIHTVRKIKDFSPIYLDKLSKNGCGLKSKRNLNFPAAFQNCLQTNYQLLTRSKSARNLKLNIKIAFCAVFLKI